MRRFQYAVAVIMTAVMCLTPVLQPYAAYAEVLAAERQLYGTSDSSAAEDGAGTSAATEDGSADEGSAGEEASSSTGGTGDGFAAVEPTQPSDAGSETAGTADSAADASTEDAQVTADETADAAAEDGERDISADEFRGNSWRFENGQLIGGLDDESARSGNFRARAMNALPEGATAQGIDVSEFQYQINWDAVKASGVDFAIIRIGWWNNGVDKYFERNVAECERLGIPWGAYLYSYSMDAEDAASEANHAIDLMNQMKAKGYTPDLPVYLDLEDKEVPLDAAKLATISSTFNGKIAAAGYEPGVYASASWWKYYLTSSVFDSWSKWSAQYYSVCEAPSDPDMWQYTSSGSVPGISGPVDVNYMMDELDDETANDGEFHVRYSSHISEIGWESDSRYDGDLSGVPELGRQIEALEISLLNQPYDGAVELSAHVSDIGWQDWNVGSAGTTGQAKHVEALRVRLTGDIANHFDIRYRVYAEGFGWLDWAENGEPAGSQSYGRSVLAIEILCVEKGSDSPAVGNGAFKVNGPVSVSYQAHVRNIGWQSSVTDGADAGTTGKALSIEALRVSVKNAPMSGSVQIRAHVSDLGWQEYTTGQAGTTGRALSIEAVGIQLTGELADRYNVYYRVHSATLGWLDWTCNGESAGTQGFAYAIEAIEIRILEKDKAAPGATDKPFITAPPKVSVSVNSDGRWLSSVTDGATAGTTNGELPIYSVRATVSRLGDLNGSIQYQTMGIFEDWGDTWASSGSDSDEISDCSPLQAVRFTLSGTLAEQYDVYYRSYTSEHGWLDWACNGENSGLSGYGVGLQAIQVKIVAKGEDAPGSTERAFLTNSSSAHVIYQAHSSEKGWLDVVSEGVAGTTGKNLGLEALRIVVSGADVSVRVRAHVSELGWQDWANNGEVAGTTGKNLPIEALMIELQGRDSASFDIYYRLHVQEYGWLDWAKNGEPAGTTGLSYKAEAIEISLVAKNDKAPGNIEVPYIEKPSVSYSSYSGDEWGSSVSSGATSGATGKSVPINAVKLTISSGFMDGGVSYRAHLSDMGWQDMVSDGAQAGIANNSHVVQALQISLTGDVSQYFDVWYRVHVEQIGWLGWTKNGATAGTTSCNLQIEAYQVVVKPKGSAAPGSSAYNASYSSVSSLPYIGFQNPSQYYQVSNKSVSIKNLGNGIFGYRTESKIPFNATRQDCVNAMITTSMDYLGTRYVWDYACAPGVGVDCSGLVLQALYATGMDLSPMNPWDHYYTPGHDHYANDMRTNARFQYVDFSNRKPGDLILSSGHVSIYIGNDQIIEASSYAGKVRVASVYSSTPILAVARPFV